MSYVFSGVRFYFDLQVAPVTPDAVELAPGVKIVVGPSQSRPRSPVSPSWSGNRGSVCRPQGL
jgi:hypothetical protein